MIASSFQKVAAQQRRAIDSFIQGYDIKAPDDPILRGFEDLTYPYYLRNYATRERLCYELIELRGVRTHHLVWDNPKAVIIKVLPPSIDPLLMIPFGEVQESEEPSDMDKLYRQLKEYRRFLQNGSAASTGL